MPAKEYDTVFNLTRDILNHAAMKSAEKPEDAILILKIYRNILIFPDLLPTTSVFSTVWTVIQQAFDKGGLL